MTHIENNNYLKGPAEDTGSAQSFAFGKIYHAVWVHPEPAGPELSG